MTTLSRSEPLDVETARAVCAIFLAALFTTRTVRNFGGPFLRELRGEKKKVVRTSKLDLFTFRHFVSKELTGVDGRRLKTKTQ